MPGKRASNRPKPIWLWVSLALVAVAVVAGALTVARRPAPTDTATAQAMALPEGFPEEPGWYRNALEPVKQAYVAAAHNHDVLQHIPCYCGCGAMHASNSACYFKRDAQGQVVAFDQHAYG